MGVAPNEAPHGPTVEVFGILVFSFFLYALIVLSNYANFQF